MHVVRATEIYSGEHYYTNISTFVTFKSFDQFLCMYDIVEVFK